MSSSLSRSKDSRQIEILPSNTVKGQTAGQLDGSQSPHAFIVSPSASEKLKLNITVPTFEVIFTTAVSVIKVHYVKEPLK